MHFQRKQLCQNCFFFIPSEKGSILKRMNLLPSKFFLFRIDPFTLGFFVQESKQEVTKSISLVKVVDNLASPLMFFLLLVSSQIFISADISTDPGEAFKGTIYLVDFPPFVMELTFVTSCLRS